MSDTAGIGENGALGEAILERRRELGWSQERLAEEAGVSDATVRKIETGYATHVQGAKLVAVRTALGMTVAGARRQVYPPDVELARDLLGLWLQQVPEEERAATVANLTMWMYGQVHPRADLPNTE